jgi:hypothetical protein
MDFIYKDKPILTFRNDYYDMIKLRSMCKDLQETNKIQNITIVLQKEMAIYYSCGGGL